MPRGEGIKPINRLFEKYRNQLIAPQGSVKKAFCEIVFDLYGYKVREDQVAYSVHNRTLTLKTPSALKTELLLKKKELITHLKGRLGEKNAPTTLL